MNGASLQESMFNRMELFVNNRVTHTDEYVGWVKGNVTKHVTNLLCTPRNRTISPVTENFTEHFATLLFTPRIESVTDTIGFMIQWAEYPPFIARGFEDYTLSAFDNLTRMTNVTELDPLDYLPSVQIGTSYCFKRKDVMDGKSRREESGREEYDENIFQFLMLWYWPMTVLLGPYWKELEHLQPWIK